MLLRGIQTAVRAAASVEDQLEACTVLLRTAFQSDACVLRELKGEDLELVAQSGLPPHCRTRALSAKEGIAARLLQDRRPVLVETVDSNPITAPFWRAAVQDPNKFQFHSYLGIPLFMADGTNVGVLGLYRNDIQGPFTRGELERLVYVGAFLSEVLMARRLRREAVAPYPRTALNEPPLVTRLRAAILAEEIDVAFQPIHEALSGRLAGFEALARWTDSETGEIPPDCFIRLAEEWSLIVPLGTLVLRRACEHFARWRTRGLASRRLFLSVNVSPDQLHHIGMATMVEETLNRIGLDLHALHLEVTETGHVTGREVGMAELLELEKRGMVMGVDDFGTGFAALTLLENLPFRTLKIDRSIVSRMETRAGRQLIASMVELGKANGLTVVAEGVETERQRQDLTNMGCRLLQGFHFAPPLTPNAAQEYIARHGRDLETPPPLARAIS